MFVFIFLFRFPPLNPDYIAREIVNGVLMNKTAITIPGYFMHILNFFKTLSYSNQNLVRDYVFKEQEGLQGN